MMLNATFNNIKGISWRSVLLIKTPEYSQKNNDLYTVIVLHRTSLSTHIFFTNKTYRH